MRIIKINVQSDLEGIDAEYLPSAITVGNFDGIHKGHQEIFKQLNDVAQMKSLRRCVILFEPHPKEVLTGKRSVKRLMSLRDKLKILDRS